MGAEEIEIDGMLISVRMPVSDVRQQDNVVEYQDATGPSRCEFSSQAIASRFADWLDAQTL